jgi:hypothetical protein
MTTLTQTESTPRFIHLRAYLAGAGATGALIAGAAVVLVSVGTFVAGLPFGASGGESGNAYMQSGPGAPAATAAALRAAAGAVAARPTGGGATGAGAGGGSGTGASGATAGASGAQSGLAPPTGSTPPGGCTTACSEPPTQPGPVTKAVQGVDNTAGTDLSGSTQGLTGTVDSTARQTLNGAGGAVGKPDLGDQVTETGNGLVDSLLPPGG